MPRIRIDQGITVDDIASRMNGTVLGDGSVRIAGICSLDEPEGDSLGFSKERSIKRLSAIIRTTPVGALLVTAPLPSLEEPPPIPLIAVADPLAAMISVIPLFYRPYDPTRASPQQVAIHPSVEIGEGVIIGPFTSIAERCVLEDGVVIYPQVTIYPGVRIGKGSVIHAGAIIREDCIIGPGSTIQNGAVIGADGFGYVVVPDKGLVPVPQIGTVKLGSHVDIGANACVDRATLGTTRIGSSTKIDNLVQVGHNTTIGSQTIVCGQVGIAGSCTIGDRVVLGGAVGVADHITISDEVRVGGGGGVMNDLLEKGDYLGKPAIPAREWFSQLRGLKRLLRKQGANSDDS